MSNQLSFRADVLTHFGATASEVEELLTYNQNVFQYYSVKKIDQPKISVETRNFASLHSRNFASLHSRNFASLHSRNFASLHSRNFASLHSRNFASLHSPEPHVAAWKEYAVAARVIGAFEVLKQRLVQFRFPILEGISETEAYRNATRKGVPIDGMTEATGLVLQQPQKLQLILHQSLVGTIPVLLTENRDDFVSLVQALTMRNEPQPIPTSMGACIVSGFNNWDRIHSYRQQWEAENFGNCSLQNWKTEFQKLIPQKQLYQDKFIILSNSPYSNISAKDMELEESQWQQLSLTIRLEHECTHYFTHRLFKSMRNNVFDELIADYRGIVAAIGYYRADWFLRFLGLESFPKYREGGRLQNYRGKPPLSDKAFQILQALVKAAAENLQCFHTKYAQQHITLNNESSILIALCHLTLEELATPDAPSRIYDILNKLPISLLR